MNNNKDINITINDLEEVIDPSIKKTNNTSIKKKQTKTIKKKKKKTLDEKKKVNAKTDLKTKYNEWLKPDGLMMIAAWTRDGLTQEQIATKIGIHRATLLVWRKNFPSINKAFKKTRDMVDTEVENALFKRAIGYNIFLKKPMKIKTDKFAEEIVYVDEEIHINGDVGAQVFWLSNRKPEVWQNTQKNAISLDEGTSQVLKAFGNIMAETKVQPINLSEDLAVFKDNTKEEI